MQHLPTQYQQFIHLSKYARFNDDLGRRETWPETVARYFDFFESHLAESHNFSIGADRARLETAVLGLGVMPSMRALMTAGPALARDHVAGYNCAYRAIDDPRAFDEILYILSCGSGVGFSAERQYVNRLPRVPDRFEKSTTIIVVRDSRRGWAEALRELIALLYSGRVPQWDVSGVRKAGERLKTFGGRASGPDPFVDLLNFTIEMFTRAAGRKLKSIEVHDLVCKIGDVIVSGGVRRSALISLSNLSDLRMRDAKSGNWYETEPWRMLANNSVAYTERPEVGQFMQEWMSLYESKSGERGFFNREAAVIQAGRSGRRKTHEGNDPIDFGCNPCSEIILRSAQFCNLSEVVARTDDTEHSLEAKVRAATALGTMQSSLTDFQYLTPAWKINCEEERLLGVSMTGIMDSHLLDGSEPKSQTIDLLEHLKEVAIEENADWAGRIGLNPAAAVTCVKPSGTVSQLVDASSGIHARHAPQYIRRVRMDVKDPLTTFMIEAGFHVEPDVMKPDHQVVFSFPVRSPETEGGQYLGDRTAVEELEHWKLFQDHWCEHKPSATVYVGEEEWPEVGSWVWNHFDEVSGVSFFPRAGHSYRQAPYEAVDEKALKELEASMPKDVDWSGLSTYETEDMTTSSQELACQGGACEI